MSRWVASKKDRGDSWILKLSVSLFLKNSASSCNTFIIAITDYSRLKLVKK